MHRHDPHELGPRQELLGAYLEQLAAANIVPLWRHLRDVMPHGAAHTKTTPTLWRWASIRPLLIRAGEVTSIEEAERRVLVLANPGHGLERFQASAGMFLGMQLVLPGEMASSHRHTPNAARIVIEGEGGRTVVQGEECRMEHGDLVLTPGGMWHEHQNAGAVPLIWLDVLDLPLVLVLERLYATAGAPQTATVPKDAYRAGGLVPLNGGDRSTVRYPLLRYEWRRTQAALQALASTATRGEPVQLAYVNPETGGACLETLAFSAFMLRPGETIALPHMSPARVFHVVEGDGEAEIDGVEFRLEQSDSFCAPGLARIRIANRLGSKPLYLIGADESPVHRKLGLYEERAA